MHILPLYMLNINLFFTAYTDNELDVPFLMEEADAKADAEAQVAELADELGRTKELYQELEQEAMVKSNFMLNTDFWKMGMTGMKW